MKDRLLLFSGNSNPQLVREVCRYCSVAPGRLSVGRFSDGEVRVEIGESVRGRDAFVLQSTCPPINENLMELLVIIDALKRASARRINAVTPYYGYGRQDEKQKPRVPISAKMVADLIATAGADRLLAIDFHADQIEGFFEIPVDHISGTEILLLDVKRALRGDEVVLAPDAAGVGRAREFARRLRVGLAIFDHRRTEDLPYYRVVGDVKGRRVIILDDMVDTGRTLVRAGKGAMAAGAAIVDAYCVHGIFSDTAMERLESSPLRSVTVTDTVPLSQQASLSEKIRTVSIAPMLARVIESVHKEESVSALFHGERPPRYFLGG
jgi:ribose-phosphate pyrophosphokinase